MTGHSKPFVYTLLSRRSFVRTIRKVPQPPTCNACRLSHTLGLASSGFARHYLRNRFCFLFLWVLRCFTSPRSLYPPYIFRRESPGHKSAQRGFPIRKSSDQGSIISSPRLIADFYVLLRLQMPRHPPFALRNLTTKIKIAIRHHPQPSARRPQIDWMTRIKDARVHCVVLNIRSAPHSPPSDDSASCGPTKDP